MSTTLKKILIMMVLLSSISVSQSNEVLFTKYQYLTRYSVLSLGDQNGDGCDDILIYDCNNVTLNIYLGGNPMDTIPDLTISTPPNTHYIGEIVAEDLNYDGFKDIMLSRYDLVLESLFTELYYGGPLLDTIPDFTMPKPEGASTAFGARLYVLDFDGDNKKELMIYDVYSPYAPGILDYYGTYYFYKTAPQIDTIPFRLIAGDITTKTGLVNYEINRIGDLNGDGKDDFTIKSYTDTSNTNVNFTMSFYFGNAEYDLSNPQIFEENKCDFNTEWMPIVKDVNGDGCDDIVLFDERGYYPYYYGNTILYGSYPIDTIPDIGLNTQNSAFMTYAELVTTDFNKDGYNDILGRFHMFVNLEARLWYGAKNMNPAGSDHVAQRRWGRLSYPNEKFGGLIAQVGDVNGDGLEEFCIGFAMEDGYSCLHGYVYIFKGDTLYRDPTGVEDLEEGDKVNNSLVIYPNPFNPETVISYELSVNSKVSLAIYDILGKEIAKLVDEEKERGRHQINFDARKHNLSSGVYLVNLNIKDKNGKEKNHSQKITFIK